MNEIGSENVLNVEHYLWHGYIVVLNYILLQSSLVYIVCTDCVVVLKVHYYSDIVLYPHTRSTIFHWTVFHHHCCN